MCRRTSDGAGAWYAVLHESLVGDDEWEEAHRVEVCSWACLRLAYMADEPDESPGAESWKGTG